MSSNAAMYRKGNQQNRHSAGPVVEPTRSGPTVPSLDYPTSQATSLTSTNSLVSEIAGNQRSAPSQIWCGSHEIMPTTGDQTTINTVVSAEIFPKVKFVDRDSQLSYNTEKRSICQFVIAKCNLQEAVIKEMWWRSAQKYVGKTINRLRNDRNTAMKKAFLGECVFSGEV